jgi:hypothetical protein
LQDIVQWSEELDFDQYIQHWTGLAITLPSDHRHYEIPDNIISATTTATVTPGLYSEFDDGNEETDNHSTTDEEGISQSTTYRSELSSERTQLDYSQYLHTGQRMRLKQEKTLNNKITDVLLGKEGTISRAMLDKERRELDSIIQQRSVR